VLTQPRPNAPYRPGAYNPPRIPQYPASAYNPTTRNAFLPNPAPIVRESPKRSDRPNNDASHVHHNNPEWRRVQHDRWFEARRRHWREYHDRYWWRNHYTRFVLLGTGYYFWDTGYWYPAYGYDPTNNTYEDEEPIYAPNEMEPSEAIANVQTALQDLGYYPYEVDGLMGPATRDAISNYQRDNGLEITSAIDQPTLESLGLE
jgi:hypothetical protein